MTRTRTVVLALLAGALALLAVPATAQITQPSAWASQYANTAYPNGAVNASYAIAAGTNRLLLVAIASRTSTAAAQTVTVTYGSQTLTLAQGDAAANQQHTYFYYLNDAGITAAGSPASLNVTITGGTAYYTWVYAAVFAGVNQTTPFTNTQGFTTNSTTGLSVGPFATALSMNANDWPIEVIFLQRSATGTTARTITTWAANWGTNTGASIPVNIQYNDTSFFPQMYITHRAVPTANTTDASQHTPSSTNQYSSMSGISLQTAPAGPTTTIGNGTAPGSVNPLCPGSALTDLDAFTLQTSTGTDSVTAVTVTLSPTGAFNNVGAIAITNSAGSTTYWTGAPTGDATAITLSTNIPVTTTATTYKIRIQPKTYAAMPAAPGATYATQGVISAFTSTNAHLGSNSTAGSGTLTIDNTNPTPGATWGTNTPGNTQITLNWTLGTAGDSVMIVRYAASTDTTFPTDGTTYTAGSAFGTGGTIRYVGNLLTFTDTGLTNGTTYYYRIFEFDGCLNYAYQAANAPWSAALTPNFTTTLGNGTAPGSSTLCPGGALTDLDAFTFATSSGTDSVTAVTVTLSPTGAFNNVGTIAITNSAGTTTYGSVTNPTADATAITLATAIPVTTTATTYKIRIQPKSYAAMPAQPGTAYATLGVISAFTCTNLKAGSNTTAGSGTLTIDNASPTPGATWGTNTPGNTQITLNWTLGTAGNSVMVVRYTANTDATFPTDGTTYTAGSAFGTGGTIRYVGNLLTFTDTGLTNGTAYYYRIFEYDGCLNYVYQAANAPWSAALTPAPPAGRSIVYSNGSTAPQGRDYDPTANSFSAAGSMPAGAAQTWIVNRGAPTRNEHIAGYISGTTLYVLRWNGTTWSSEWSASVGGTNGRRFDIAYEQVTGDCLVVYSNNTTGTNNMRYRVWNGTTWTAATNLTAAQLSVAPNYIRMATRPGSDQIALAVADATSPALLSALIWSGTAWGNEPTLLTNVVYQSGAPGDVPSFDVAFESATGNVLIVNSINGANNLNWSRFVASTSTWSTNNTLAAGTARPYGAVTLRANPDTASNQILLATCGSVAAASAATYYSVWSGTAWSTLTTGGNMSANYAVNRLPFTGGWLKSGATTAGIVFYSTATANRIDYYYTTNGGTNWTAGNNTAITTAAQARYWWDAAVYFASADSMMVTYSDAASDLWAKRVVLSAGPTFTFTNSDGGTALTTTLASITTQNFDFDWDGLSPNRTIVGTVTVAQAIGATPSVTVTAPYTGDPNGNNTLSYRYRTPSGTGTYNLPTTIAHSASPYTFTISGMTCGASYDIEVTYVDTDGVSGTNPQTVAITPTNCTTAGSATASSTTCTGITISAPYTNDGNTNNTLSYRYKTPSGGGTYNAPTTVAHAASPYSVPIAGLTFGATYDVEVTYVDADGVSGTAVQTLTGVTAGANCTAAGTATVAQTPGATPSLLLTAPYTGDANANNTLSYRYRTPTGTGTWTTATPVTHSLSPYSVTIASLTCGSSYDVEVTYLDADGIGSGTAVQTLSNIVMTNCTVTGTVTATGGACGSISVSAPYTQDANGNNTLSYRYRTPTGTGTWTTATAVAHSTSPNNFTISGLAAGSYDVEVTYVDADGVTGTNPRTVTNLTVTAACTTVGTVTAVPTAGTCSSITVTAPYSGDSNANNTLSYRYRTPTGTGTWVGPTSRAHSASPYSFNITGLTAATTYDVEVTYVDTTDGVSGTNPQTVTNIVMPDCRVQPGVPSAVVNACNQIVVSAPYTNDANSNSTTTISRGPSGTGPWTTVCSAVTGASPRSCTDNTVAASSTYYYQVSFVDADGIIGTNPQVIGPFTTPACAINNTIIGAVTVALSSCNSATVTATFTGDANNNGSTTFEYGAGAIPATWTTACVAAGPSPRQCVVTGLTASTLYSFRATYADADGVTGTNPPASVQATTPACGTDTVAPTVTMLMPTDGSILSGIDTFKVQVFDASGTAGLTVQYQLDGTTGAWTSMTLNATYPNCGTNCGIYTAAPTTAPSAGGHYVAIKATDGAGNATIVTTAFAATSAGAGTGLLLRRSHGSELCIDCHNLATHSSQNTSTTYGSWSFDCLTCHTPHKTHNIYLVKDTIKTPNSGAKSLAFYNTTGVAANSFGTPTASGSGVGACEICHTKTKNTDGSARARNNASTDWTKHYTTNCVGCHPHGKGFAAGESEGSANCSGCHSTIWGGMTGGVVKTTKHTLGSVVGTNDSFTDTTAAWTSPLNANASTARSCVNMCHDDHPHIATDDPNATLHYNLAYDDASTNASRAATTRTVATKAKTDFDNSLGSGGMCMSCHKNPVESGTTPTHPALAQANYNASAHNVTSTTTYTPGAPPTHRASATATGTTATITINKPPGTLQGDLMIANIAWSTTATNTNPPTLSGWTLLSQANWGAANPYRHGATLWKLAGATEGASYAFTIGGTSTTWVVTGGISSFTGVDQITPIGVVGTHASNNTAGPTITATGITTPSNNSLVVFFAQVGVASPTFSAWTTASAGPMTQIYNSGVTAAMNVGAATVTDPTAGATGNGTVAITSATWGGVLVAVDPPQTANTTPWAYTLHDGSNFTRNCTKCHWDATDGTTPTITGKTAIGAVHSNANLSLLMGTTNPNGTPAGMICYRCHGGGTTGADYSGKQVYQDGSKAYKHPMDADNVHVTTTELYNAAWGNTLGVTGRHSNCLDCHEPHAAQKTIKSGTATATTSLSLTDSTMNGRWTAGEWNGAILYVPTAVPAANNITGTTAAGVINVFTAWTTIPAAGAAYTIYDNHADMALQGAWGAQLSTNPTTWAEPASTNFTKNTAIAAGTDLEATLCLKCHSNYYWGTGTPPNGVSPNGSQLTPPETNVAKEFNPNNLSAHPVLASLNNMPNSVAPKPLLATQMKAPWNVNVGNQTMSCSDCHTTDAASPAAQGPHGSAAQFMLRVFPGGPAPSTWPNSPSGGTAIVEATWCGNCHTTGSTANPGHTDSNHNPYYCYTCHIVVPHGAKVSRLMIPDANSACPPRYYYNGTRPTNILTHFAKTSGTYSGTQCGCTTQHTGGGAEVW